MLASAIRLSPSSRRARELWPGTILAILAVLMVPAFSGGAESFGRIEGSVTHEDGTALAAVRVTLRELGRAEVTGKDGSFRFRRVPPGTYTLDFALGANRAAEERVVVVAGSKTTVRMIVDWAPQLTERLTVFAASRRRERVVEAPAAVSIVTAEEIEQEALGSTASRLLEFVPGVETFQASADWYVINSRGFAGALNRRLLLQIDGRDVATPFTRSPEWGALLFPVDDLASIELVRGPGSALYGAGAFNGVIDIRSRSPADALGGRVRFAVTERNTSEVDLRYAADLGNGWMMKLVGRDGAYDSDSVARTASVEYSRPCTVPGEKGCLPLEAVAPPKRRGDYSSGQLRFDHQGRGGTLLTLETGASRYAGGVAFVTDSGRYQTLWQKRPWLRVHVGAARWNVNAYYDARSSELLHLPTGGRSYLDEDRVHLEVQGNAGFAGGRGFLVGGASVRRERIDTADPRGLQTQLREPGKPHYEALFGQAEYKFADRLRAVVSARWDASSLYENQLSPRASLVYSIRPNHSLRSTWGRAFLAPSYAEAYLYTAVAAPVDLSGFEAFCAPYGVSCGFDQAVPVLALGNESLDVEQVRSLELEYRGVFANKLYLSLALYRSEIKHFITGMLPLVNPTLGRINPGVAPYAPPDELPPAAAAALLATLEASLPPGVFPLLSNDRDGTPMIAALSYANFGQVDVQGAELALRYDPAEDWRIEFAYTYFNADVGLQLEEDPLAPNTADGRLSVGLTYSSSRTFASLRYRYATGHEWRSGSFWGPVPAFDMFKLSAGCKIGGGWEVRLEVDNLLDDRHYEQFGGDLLRRRAGVGLIRNW